MDTIKIDKKQCRLVAHRGLSGMEKENSCAAFVLAGSRSYYGIETDVHVTCDGKYLISHDSNLSRVSGVDIEIEKSPFDVLQSVSLFDTDGVSRRTDLVPPALSDYVSICKKYGKVSVLELKGLIEEKHIAGIVDTVLETVTLPIELSTYSDFLTWIPCEQYACGRNGSTSCTLRETGEDACSCRNHSCADCIRCIQAR